MFYGHGVEEREKRIRIILAMLDGWMKMMMTMMTEINNEMALL